MPERYKKWRNRICVWLFNILRRLMAAWDSVIVFSLCLMLAAGVIWYAERYTSREEASVRSHVVRVAESYLGCKEADGTHREIVDIYNAYEPRARGYEVTYEDSWCAVFGSTVALQADLLGWIPLECSCEQQILLFDAQNQWIENDGYYPKPGDYIYYDWNAAGTGDCTGWSDHVGIVVSVFGGAMKVIEGNNDDDVSYRYLFVNDPFIRGFGIPDYSHYATMQKNFP